MKKLIFLILLFPVSVLAQDKDLFNLSYRYTKLKNTDTSKTVKTLDAYLALPISNNENHQLAALLSYRQVWTGGFADSYPQTLYATSARIGYQIHLTKKHQLRFFGQLGAYSDFQNFTSDALRWTIGSEYIIQNQGNNKFGFGLAYTKQFYGHQIVPLIELDQQFNDRWSIAGIFPVNPRLEYKISDKSKTGIELNIDVSTYRFSSLENTNQYLKTTQSNISLFYRYNIFKHWNLNFKAGFSPKQEFGIYDQNNQSTWTLLTIPLGEKPQAEERFHNSAFSGQLGIAYSLF